MGGDGRRWAKRAKANHRAGKIISERTSTSHGAAILAVSQSAEIGADRIARAPSSGHLVGSTASMQESFRNLTQHLGMTDKDARKLVEWNPRVALGENPASC